MNFKVVCILLLATSTRLAAQRPDSLPLSLNDAVARAMQSGDEVLLAQAQVELASAQMTTARASALPQLRLSGTYTHVMENARAQAVGQIFNQPNTYTSNANLTQSVFQGGRAISGIRASTRLRTAARLTADEARNTVSFNVQNAYLTALFAQQLVEIQQANLELAEAQLKQVTQFEASGRAARYDVLRARVQRTNIEPQLIAARNELELAQLELKRLTNIPATQPVKLTTRIDAQQIAPLIAQVTQSTIAVDDRPSVQAAKLTAEARHIGVSVARADWLPTINVFFQTGYSAFPKTGFPQGFNETGGWYPDRSLGVQFSWPLFDGLRTKGNIDAAQAQARIADLQLQQEREDVALEIEQARSELQRAQAAFSAQQQNASEANEAFRLASLRFTRGLSTQLDVSDAQIALMTARTNEARSIYDLYLAAAALARAQGKTLQ